MTASWSPPPGSSLLPGRCGVAAFVTLVLRLLYTSPLCGCLAVLLPILFLARRSAPSLPVLGALMALPACLLFKISMASLSSVALLVARMLPLSPCRRVSLTLPSSLRTLLPSVVTHSLLLPFPRALGPTSCCRPPTSVLLLPLSSATPFCIFSTPLLKFPPAYRVGS